MSKTRGDIAEISFLLKAKQNGFMVLTPFSSISPYDVAIDNGDKILKIQVKSTDTEIVSSKGVIYKNCYKVAISHGSKVKRLYSKDDVDYFAIYLTRLDKFYIIPHNIIKTMTLNLYPTKPGHKLNKYLERWDLLR